MKYCGIDIGSTAAKVVILDENKDKILYKKMLPTGWNSKNTALLILEDINKEGYLEEELVITSTGYGRISVPYADKVVTEITCHAMGAIYLSKETELIVIDIGGQDTKIISIENGLVNDFIMNDKCSAGTGRFLEVISNSMGVSLEELFDFAKKGEKIEISSMCTVFAESEVISLIGGGAKKEDIAAGIINSVIKKVSTQAYKHKGKSNKYFLTGGFSNNEYVIRELEEILKGKVMSHEDGRFAGALGAAIIGKRKK